MSVRLVVSIEAGTSTEWQASLLCYSLLRAGEPAPLTVLCAGGPATEPMAGAEVIVTPSYRHLDGGNYAPFNKPCGIVDWFRVSPPEEDWVLLLDPDMVLFAPLPPPPEVPTGEYYPSNKADLTEPHVRALTRNPGLLQPVGIPLWLPREALRAVAPGWRDRTVALRRVNALHDAWVVEMVGYQLAAADLGIRHRCTVHACGPNLLHYAPGICGMWWRKHRYQPWGVPAPAGSSNPTLVAFVALLSEYAALRRAAVGR